MRPTYQCGQGQVHARILPTVEPRVARALHRSHERLRQARRVGASDGSATRTGRLHVQHGHTIVEKHQVIKIRHAATTLDHGLVREAGRLGHLLDRAENGVELQLVGHDARLHEEVLAGADPIHERQDLTAEVLVPRIEKTSVHPTTRTHLEGEMGTGGVGPRTPLQLLPHRLAVLGDPSPAHLPLDLVDVAVGDRTMVRPLPEDVTARLDVDHHDGLHTLRVDEAVGEAEVPEHDVLVTLVEDCHEKNSWTIRSL